MWNTLNERAAFSPGAPDPPSSLYVWCYDQERRAILEWKPGIENYAPILNFILQFNTTFAPDTW